METLSTGYYEADQAGKNEIEIFVINTEANQRAVGSRHHILDAIDISGMEGPVQILPHINQELTLRQVPNDWKKEAAPKKERSNESSQSQVNSPGVISPYRL